MFLRQDFRESIDSCAESRNENSQNLQDTRDGYLYKEFESRNILAEGAKRITFSWYTDGVDIFKSSKFKIWHFLLTVNEVHYQERFKLDNIILTGLWFSESDSIPDLFLQSMVQSKN